MAKERIFNFNEGCNVTFNDIHDNTHCTIIVPKNGSADEKDVPAENDYKALCRWIEKEKEAGRDWYKMSDNNRSRMCRELSRYVGWVVDQNSLRKAQQSA